MRLDVPFEKLVERLRPERSLGADPVDSPRLPLASFLPSRASTLNLPGIEELRYRELPNRGAGNSTCSSSWARVGEEISCTVEYNSDVFDGDTVQGLLEHYKVLLEAASISPACAVAELPLLAPEERRRVLVEWNATEAGTRAPRRWRLW